MCRHSCNTPLQRKLPVICDIQSLKKQYVQNITNLPKPQTMSSNYQLGYVHSRLVRNLADCFSSKSACILHSKSERAFDLRCEHHLAPPPFAPVSFFFLGLTDSSERVPGSRASSDRMLCSRNVRLMATVSDNVGRYDCEAFGHYWRDCQAHVQKNRSSRGKK